MRYNEAMLRNWQTYIHQVPTEKMQGYTKALIEGGMKPEKLPKAIGVTKIREHKPRPGFLRRLFDSFKQESPRKKEQQ
jgi:hypothetical protein